MKIKLTKRSYVDSQGDRVAMYYVIKGIYVLKMTRYYETAKQYFDELRLETALSGGPGRDVQDEVLEEFDA